MSKVYVLCGEGYEETIIFGVFDNESRLVDAFYEVEKYNIEYISCKVYKFNLNRIEGSHDHELNMFLEQAEEVKIHDIERKIFMEGIRDNMGVK